MACTAKLHNYLLHNKLMKYNRWVSNSCDGEGKITVSNEGLGVQKVQLTSDYAGADCQMKARFVQNTQITGTLASYTHDPIICDDLSTEVTGEAVHEWECSEEDRYECEEHREYDETNDLAGGKSGICRNYQKCTCKIVYGVEEYSIKPAADQDAFETTCGVGFSGPQPSEAAQMPENHGCGKPICKPICSEGWSTQDLVDGLDAEKYNGITAPTVPHLIVETPDRAIKIYGGVEGAVSALIPDVVSIQYVAGGDEENGSFTVERPTSFFEAQYMDLEAIDGSNAQSVNDGDAFTAAS